MLSDQELKALLEAASKGLSCCKEEASAGPRHRVWLYRCPDHGISPVMWSYREPTDLCNANPDGAPWSEGCNRIRTLVGPGDEHIYMGRGATRCDKDCSACFPAEMSAGRRLAALAPALAQEVLDRRRLGEEVAGALRSDASEIHGSRHAFDAFADCPTAFCFERRALIARWAELTKAEEERDG